MAILNKEKSINNGALFENVVSRNYSAKVIKNIILTAKSRVSLIL